MINTVTLVGRVGQDPTVKYFEGGSVKVTTSLAVTRNKEVTDWFNVEAWGKTGDIVTNYVRKGSQIAVKGAFKTESWLDTKSGEERTKVVILVDQIELLGGKKQEEEVVF